MQLRAFSISQTDLSDFGQQFIRGLSELAGKFGISEVTYFRSDARGKLKTLRVPFNEQPGRLAQPSTNEITNHRVPHNSTDDEPHLGRGFGF